MSDKTAWTPYGLEAIRVRHLRRRRVLALLIALGLAGLWAFMFETTTTTSQEIFVNGQRAGNGITIDQPQTKEDGPVTVAIAPGRVTRAESGSAPAEDTPIGRTSAPTYTRADPIPYDGYVIIYGPMVLLLIAGWLLAKKKGRHDQVNYGIYKGAMPLELVSASQSTNIFTTRMAKAGLFGKRRVDHLPEEILQAEPAREQEA